eukprot:2573710-Amphidinium_carterae.1
MSPYATGRQRRIHDSLTPLSDAADFIESVLCNTYTNNSGVGSPRLGGEEWRLQAHPWRPAKWSDLQHGKTKAGNSYKAYIFMSIWRFPQPHVVSCHADGMHERRNLHDATVLAK